MIDEPTASAAFDYDSVRMCECCVCGYVLLGGGQEHLRPIATTAGYLLPRTVAGRVDGRPYCGPCLRAVVAAAASRRRRR